jgi:hypothetical protein
MCEYSTPTATHKREREREQREERASSTTADARRCGLLIPARPNFHTPRYIYPLGFKSVRPYTSVVGMTLYTLSPPFSFTTALHSLRADPSRKCDYISEICDGGTDPKFVVTCTDDPDHPFVR